MTTASIPTAKGAQAPFAVRRNSPGVLPGFGISMGYAVLYLSVLVLIPLAALPIKSASLGWQGFWDAVTAPRVLASYQLTFGASLLAALVNLVFGTIVAWVLVRYRFPGKKILDALVDLPFALPTAVAGIALTALYAEKGWLGAPLANWFGLKVAFTPLGIVIALIFIGVPFVVRTVQPVLEDIEREIEEAAASLGADRWQTIRRVLLPSLVPALAHVHRGGVLAGEQHAARVGRLQPGDDAQQRGLATARRPQQRHQLARLDVQRNVVERPELAEALGKIAYFDTHACLRLAGRVRRRPA